MHEPLPLKPDAAGLPTRYDADEGLKKIAVLEAGEKHWARAKDPEKLFTAISEKLRNQAKYIVWRDSVVQHGGDRKSKLRRSNFDPLPEADPGPVVAHRWRTRFCSKVEGKTAIDEAKLARALEDAQRRVVAICEQDAGFSLEERAQQGAFERFTTPEVIEAARQVLGRIDLDPASCEIAQQTVRAKKFFTIEDDALGREWVGKVFLNPPFFTGLYQKFIDKLVGEIKAGRVTAAILLTNSRTDPRWFSTAVSSCASVCFSAGRLHFALPTTDGQAAILDSTPMRGQVLFYYGQEPDCFEQEFSKFGNCLRPSRLYDAGGGNV